MTNEEHILQEANIIYAERSGVTVTATMVLHSYLSSIEKDIALGQTYKDIILRYNLQIKPESFATLWRTATNTSVTDVVRKSPLEQNLAKKGYTPEQIADILECA